MKQGTRCQSGRVGLNNTPLRLSLLICEMGAHEQVPLHRAQLRERADAPARDGTR